MLTNLHETSVGQGIQAIPPAMDVPVAVVPVRKLHERLGFAQPIAYPESSLHKPLTQWRMEDDDSPIFRYLYRNFRPNRHLEFGTWQGTGVLYCLEECAATVWTINLLKGEERADGSWAYGTTFDATEEQPTWANKIVCEKTWYQTDSLGFIGKNYLDRGMGKRVCQIYCDSREWDNSNYPRDFFDSALIDGGHDRDVVTSDTRKALEVVRPGGLVMWHDFCLDPQVLAHCAAPQGVVASIREQLDSLRSATRDLFWVFPSWILVGIKR